MTTSSPSHTPRPVALISGAGSGIGQAAAILLAGHGYDVALVARTASRLDDTAAQCRAASSACRALTIPLDVSQPDAPARIVAQVEQTFGRLDALFNIAGNAPLLPIHEVTPAIWQTCVATNLSSAILLTAAAWPLFTRQKSGFVGNISSMSSVDPFPGFGIYAAAKSGLNMFTHCTAQEGQAIGVRAVAIAPGAVETPMLRQHFDEATIPADQALLPRQVAQVLVACLRKQRSFQNGETILLPTPSSIHEPVEKL